MDANTRVSNGHRNGQKNNEKIVTKSLVVTTADWVHDYIVNIHFNDGTEQQVNFEHYLTTHDHPMIRPFNDPERFKSFYVDNGNLVWGENWEMIFPTWKLHRGYV